MNLIVFYFFMYTYILLVRAYFTFIKLHICSHGRVRNEDYQKTTAKYP